MAPIEAASKEIYECTKAICTGVGAGLGDLVDTILHPIDNLLYPISELAYDAVIISAAHTNQISQIPDETSGTSPDLQMLHQLIQKNPELYQNSAKRMQEKLEGLKKMGAEFTSAPTTKKIEAMSRIATNIMAPGYFLKAFKVTSNIHKFGIPYNPPVFKPDMHKILTPSPPILLSSLEDIRKITGEQVLLYVITDENKLLIAPRTYPGILNRNGKATTHIFHPELAGLRSVVLSGDVIVKDGKIVALDNQSGHFRTFGAHLSKLAETTFKKYGFKEVDKHHFVDYSKSTGKTGQTIKKQGTKNFPAKKHANSNSFKPQSFQKKMGKEPSIFGAAIGATNSMFTSDTEIEYEIVLDEVESEGDEKLNQERKRVKEAKKQAEAKAVKLSSKKGADSSVENTNFAFNQETLSQIQTFAENLGYTGLVVSEISQAAIALGGHQRTWKDIGARGMGAYKIYYGFTVASTVGGGPLGALMIFNGLIEMVNGCQESTAYEEIYAVLVEIRNILIQGLNQLSKQMSEGFNSVLYRLHKITMELDRLEPLISSSFKEIHIKELVDIIDEVKKDIDGEFTLSDDEKRKCLRRLSTWIDRHSKAKIQTALLRDSKDMSKCLELLEDSSFNLSSQLPFLILQLFKVLPQELFKNKDLSEMPNLIVLADACEVFVLLINHYQFQDNYLPTLQRALKSFEFMQSFIKEIKEEPKIWDILLRQYEGLRYQVGRAICKCRREISLNNELSLGEQLKASPNKDQLMTVLDQLEMRRVLLQRLAELTDCDKETYEKIQKLEKKSDILMRSGKFYQDQVSQFLTSAANEKYLEFSEAIKNGADINAWDSWGQAIHYISRERAKNYSDAIKLLHELFKSGKDLDACYTVQPNNLFERRTHGTKNQYGTWGSWVLPITWMMNSGYFDLGLLYCASGFDIVMSGLHFMNGLTWAGKSNWKHYVQYYLVCEMNNEKSFLNKKDLRKAYEYYKAVEAGVVVSSENASKVSQDCLLWLTCVLGDTTPLLTLNASLKEPLSQETINRSIPKTGFTPLLMAINCNHREIANWLMKLGANRCTELEKAVGEKRSMQVEYDIEKDSSPLMHIAVTNKYFDYAKELREAGCVATSEQSKKIEEGLKAVALAQSAESKSKAESKNKVEIETVSMIPQPPSQTLLLINKQMENLNKTIFYFENQTEVKQDTKQDKEASGIKDEFTKILAKCNLNYKLINHFISKIEQENALLQLAKEELKNLKESLAKINSFAFDGDLSALRKVVPVMQLVVDSFDTIDGILKSDADLQYSLGNTIDRMLTDIRDFSKKCNKGISLKI